MKRRTTLFTLIAIGAVAAAAILLRETPTAAASGSMDEGLYEVTRGDLNVTLTENGTLVAKDSQKIQPKARRRCKISFLIEEGEVVEQGDEICKFETTELEEQIAQLVLDIVKAEADFDTAETDLEIQHSDNTSAIKKAEIAAEKAQKELEKYLEGDFRKQKRDLDIAIKDGELAYQKSLKTLNDSKRLFEEEFIKQTELEQDQISHDRAAVQVEGAQIDLDIFNRFTHPIALKEKQNGAEEAVRALDTAKKKAKSNVRQKEVAVEQYDKRLKNLQKQKEKYEEDMGNMTLVAPCPGIIIYGDPQWGWVDENVKVGGEIWGGNTIMTIPDLRVMQVKLQIHEADISKVDEEQIAKISMDSYPGLFLEGKVTKIAAIAANARDGGEVRKFDVDLTLDPPEDLELRPGISARAEIQIDLIKDTPYVPLQCVFVEGDTNLCYVMGADGSPERRKIEAGMSNDSYIAITSGLEEGEMVLLYNPSLPGVSTSEEEAGETTGGEAEAEDPGVTAPIAPPSAPPNAGS